MKKWIFIFLFLLLPSIAAGQRAMTIHGPVTPAAAPSGCTCAATYSLKESFEGTGYENSWTEDEGGGTHVLEDNTGPGSLPSGGGSQCLQLNNSDPDRDWDDARACWQAGTAITTFYLRFWLYIVEDTLANTEIADIAGFNYAGGDGMEVIQIYKNATQMELRLHYYDKGFGQWANSTSLNISTAQWYRIDLYYLGDNSAPYEGKYTFRVDGNVIEDHAANLRLTGGIGINCALDPKQGLQFCLGDCAGGAVAIMTIDFDCICVKIDDWPGS